MNASAGKDVTLKVAQGKEFYRSHIESEIMSVYDFNSSFEIPYIEAAKNKVVKDPSIVDEPLQLKVFYKIKGDQDSCYTAFLLSTSLQFIKSNGYRSGVALWKVQLSDWIDKIEAMQKDFNQHAKTLVASNKDDWEEKIVPLIQVFKNLIGMDDVTTTKIIDVINGGAWKVVTALKYLAGLWICINADDVEEHFDQPIHSSDPKHRLTAFLDQFVLSTNSTSKMMIHVVALVRFFDLKAHILEDVDHEPRVWEFSKYKVARVRLDDKSLWPEYFIGQCFIEDDFEQAVLHYDVVGTGDVEMDDDKLLEPLV